MLYLNAILGRILFEKSLQNSSFSRTISQLMLASGNNNLVVRCQEESFNGWTNEKINRNFAHTSLRYEVSDTILQNYQLFTEFRLNVIYIYTRVASVKARITIKTIL